MLPTDIVRVVMGGTPSPSYLENGRAFAAWLEEQEPRARSRVQARAIVEREEQMRGVLEGALLDPQTRALMQGWLELYLRILKCFIGSDSGVG